MNRRIQWRHCCIVKLQNEHYCNSSTSEYRQSHNSLKLPQLWQTLTDSWTAPTHGCSDRPCSWRQLWVGEWTIGGKEWWFCVHSAESMTADPEQCKNSSWNCSGGIADERDRRGRREGKSSQRDDAAKRLFPKTALKPMIKSLKQRLQYWKLLLKAGKKLSK